MDGNNEILREIAINLTGEDPGTELTNNELLQIIAIATAEGGGGGDYIPLNKDDGVAVEGEYSNDTSLYLLFLGSVLGLSTSLNINSGALDLTATYEAEGQDTQTSTFNQGSNILNLTASEGSNTGNLLLNPDSVNLSASGSLGSAGFAANAGNATISSVVPTSPTDMPSAPAGSVAFDDDYMYVKTSTDWKRVALEEWVV